MAGHLLPERNCDTCNELNKASWGCTTDSKIIMEFDGEIIKRCPNRPFLDDPELVSLAFTYYNWYKKGHFPEEGTWLDQPAAFVDLVSYMDICVRDAEEQKRKEDELRSKLRERTNSLN